MGATALGRTLSKRLVERRARFFVGREDELTRLLALLEPTATRRVAHVSGPGGVGKTELLVELARQAGLRRCVVAWLDASQLPPSEVAFTEAARAALNEAGAWEARRPALLVIDGFEVVASLEGWFRDLFLPSLPDELRVVCAGRDPLAPAWRASAGWGSLLEAIELDNLDAADATEYLARRDVPEAFRAGVVRLTRGHALALALFTDVVRSDGGIPTLEERPELVQVLLETLVRSVPDDLHRQTLWSAALVKRTTEEMLRSMVDEERAPALFEWLRGLSFMRADSGGLWPHDLVRDVLNTDLEWRYPQLRRRLLGLAARHYLEGLRAFPSLRTANLLSIAFMRRAEIPFTGFSANGLYASSLRASDWPTLDAMVLRHEGLRSAQWLRFWADRGGEVLVVRRPSGEAQAVVLYLWMDRLAPEDAVSDPGVAEVYRDLEARSALPGAVYLRFVIDRDSYQDPAASMVVLTAYQLESFARRPDLSVVFSAWSNLDLGLSGMPPGMLEHFEPADFELDKARYTVVRTNNGDEPAWDWFIEGLVGPLIGAIDGHATSPAAQGLDRAGFEAEVRRALRDFHRPERLAESALLGSRLVSAALPDGVGRLAAVEVLRALLLEGCELQRQGDPDDLGARVLEHTFLSGRSKQLRVALELNIPYSTYRRHLRAAIQRLTEWLWLRETSRSEAA